MPKAVYRMLSLMRAPVVTPADPRTIRIKVEGVRIGFPS
jgi:hypothetical protein